MVNVKNIADEADMIINERYEIDDGIRPYCFLVERLGHVRCIRFKSDIARESKYEESGGKAI